MAERPKNPFDDFEDTSGLTDADWTVINKLKRAYDEGDTKSLSSAMARLTKDPIRYAGVLGAIFPHEMREAIKDAMAERGLTEEDLRDLMQKLERGGREH